MAVPLRTPTATVLAPVLALVFLLGAWSWRGTRASAAASSVSNDASGFTEERVTSLGVRPPLPDATQLVRDAGFNPLGISLGADHLIGLQAIVDRVNAELATLQDVMNHEVQSWAMTRIQLGSYRLLRADDESRPSRGAVLVRVSSRDGSEKEVEIRPGECAEVDVLVLDMDALLEQGETQVRNYIESCATGHEEGV